MNPFTGSYWPSTLTDPLEIFPKGGIAEEMGMQVFPFSRQAALQKVCFRVFGTLLTMLCSISQLPTGSRR